MLPPPAGAGNPPLKSALAQPRSDGYGRSSRARGIRPLWIPPQSLEKRALLEVAVTGQLAPETPFEAACCHRAGHCSVANQRLQPRGGPRARGFPHERPRSSQFVPRRPRCGRRGAMISSVLSGRSRPRGSGHTHCTTRTGFVVDGCSHRVGERIDRGGS